MAEIGKGKTIEELQDTKMETEHTIIDWICL